MFDHLYIDGDLLVYRCGFACEHDTYELWKKKGGHEGPSFIQKFTGKRALNVYIKAECEKNKWSLKQFENRYTWSATHYTEPVSFAIQAMQTALNGIFDTLQCDVQTIYLSQGECFRHTFYPEYKANRKDAPKPTHYEKLRQHLLGKWGAVEIDELEADDLCGISSCADQTKGETPVIVTVDKDLDMIPGWHYNWVKQHLYEVTKEQADRTFFQQVLTGDMVDNIPGLKGIGPVKAAKMLAKDQTIDEMNVTVQKAYEEAGRGKDLDTVMDAIWILRAARPWDRGVWYVQIQD
jgi:DNA polymerase-1